MSDTADGSARPHAAQAAGAAASLAALGVVFGDIGTSPLYTFTTVLDAAGAHPAPRAILGALSLIFWTLIIVTAVKYVMLAMRIDNDGEGGILALMSLLGVKKQQRRVIVLVGLLGAALIYGDGAITPAISVLSALEGIDIVAPSFQHFVLPVTVVILLVLFAVQRQGTARIGRLFGPVMAVWFATIALLGVAGIARDPAVLRALDPLYGLSFLASGGMAAFAVLGGVFLCVTGAEALYADMGHFGPKPIRRAWWGVVLPSLVLNYAGQAALELSGPAGTGNIFFRLCPPLLLVPLVVLATVATIIASQSIITGAFSMTRQAIQLGWMPRLQIAQTSSHGYGQIYVGAVNWLLMIATIGLAVGFRKSDNLASAYGIAVSLTMLMTTMLLFIAMREVWHWGILRAAAVAGALLVVDVAFVSANMLKLADGGYVPLLLAGAVYGIMLIWHTGVRAVGTRIADSVVPIATLTDRLTRDAVPRVPGTAVFLTRTDRDAPPSLLWHLKHSRALQRHVLVLTVVTEPVPWILPADHLTVTPLAADMWRGNARFGFMERPDVPALLAQAQAAGCGLDLDDVTYFVGHETIVAREERPRLARPVAAAFAFLQRNSAHVTDYLRLPAEQVVEIGRQIAL
ncbi:MAG: KUP/HAK/KT family potassium transporter [Proteobacteria bacterium]|nr:KUP/HAK/KT family potassium transporter [Pseudomonadota bacterium]